MPAHGARRDATRTAGTCSSPNRIRPIGTARRSTRPSASWAAILVLYDGLLALTRSPVVAVNRAAALAETAGPETALAALDAVADDPRLAAYQPYWATRADLLARLG